MRVLLAAVLAFVAAGIAGGFFGAMLRDLFPYQLRGSKGGLDAVITLVLLVPLFFSFLRIVRRPSTRRPAANGDPTERDAPDT